MSKIIPFIILSLLFTLSSENLSDIKFELLNDEIDSLQQRKIKKLNEIKLEFDRIMDKEFTLDDKRVSISKRELLSRVLFRIAYGFHEYEEYKEQNDYQKILTYKEIASKSSVDSEKELAFNRVNMVLPSVTMEQFLSDEIDLLELYRPNYSQSQAYYNKLIDKFPDSEFSDDAIFNLGYIHYENLEKVDQGVNYFKTLLEKYPETRYREVSNFILGEYYFDPDRNPDGDLKLDSIYVNKAITYYRNVVNSPQFNENYYYKALYRLGFSYYRTYSFDKAAKYLTRTIEELYENYGGSIDVEKQNMLNLCIEYLAFSFRDRPWEEENMVASSLKEHILTREDMGKNALKHYGSELFKTLGYVYKSGGDYQLAITSFDSLLTIYPLYKEAPLIKEEILNVYKENPELDSSEKEEILYKRRLEQFSDYKKDANWDKTHKDRRDSLSVDSLLSKNMLLNINSIQVKAQQNSSGPMFEETISLIDNYLEELPPDSNYYRLNWYKGSIFGKNLDKYKQSYDIFMKLSRDSLTTEYSDELSGSEFNARKAAKNAINMAGKIRENEKKNKLENND